jgi:hypothetical protein
MGYNAEKKSFLCVSCGPGHNKWKNIFTSVLMNEETGEIYCLFHRDKKIGHTSEVPEWRNNGK